VLTGEKLNWVTSQILNGEFVDGKITAGVGASSVKDNLQLKAGCPLANELNKVVIQALWRAQLFQMATRPKIIRPAIFSKYEPGILTQQITWAAGNSSRINGNLLHHRRLVLKTIS
jgi:PKHD-type hydroxylase